MSLLHSMVDAKSVLLRVPHDLHSTTVILEKLGPAEVQTTDIHELLDNPPTQFISRSLFTLFNEDVHADAVSMLSVSFSTG